MTDEIGADDFAEVVDLFLSEVEEVLERLQQRQGPDHLADDLHFLKGSAWNLGFADFGEACAQAEKQSASGQSQGVNLAAIAQCYQASKVCFFATLPAGRPADTALRA